MLFFHTSKALHHIIVTAPLPLPIPPGACDGNPREQEASSKAQTVHSGFFANQGSVATVGSAGGGSDPSGQQANGGGGGSGGGGESEGGATGGMGSAGAAGAGAGSGADGDVVARKKKKVRASAVAAGAKDRRGWFAFILGRVGVACPMFGTWYI